jgi:hypothetical protein
VDGSISGIGKVFGGDTKGRENGSMFVVLLG